jgi:hypothetical protein
VTIQASAFAGITDVIEVSFASGAAVSISANAFIGGNFNTLTNSAGATLASVRTLVRTTAQVFSNT